MFPTPRSRRTLAALLACGALSASLLSVSSAQGVAAPSKRAQVYRTFNALSTNIGPIPDGPNTGGTCSTQTPSLLDLQIPVSGMTAAPLNYVRVDLSIQHSKIGDLGVQLVAPNGTTVVIFDRIGANLIGCGDETGLNGTFSFRDGAPGNLAANTAAASDTSSLTGGTYFPSTAAGSAIPLTAPLTNTAANGTWKLRIFDNEAGNTGRVYAAKIVLGQGSLSATTACAAATSAYTQASAAATRAYTKLKRSKATLTKVRRHGSKAAVKRANKKVKHRKAVRKITAHNASAAAAAKTRDCGR